MGLHVIQKDLENLSPLITDNAFFAVLTTVLTFFWEGKIVKSEPLIHEPWFLQSKIFDEYIGRDGDGTACI